VPSLLNWIELIAEFLAEGPYQPIRREMFAQGGSIDWLELRNFSSREFGNDCEKLSDLRVCQGILCCFQDWRRGDWRICTSTPRVIATWLHA
jgi:hypothetical protein